MDQARAAAVDGRVAARPELGDAVWSAKATTPDAIEAALRELLTQRAQSHRARVDGGLVQARVLNMIVFVESRFTAETATRLRGVGRYDASRTVLLAYEPDREQLDARVTVSSEDDPGDGGLELLRETVIVEIGKRHLDDLATIADPLVLSDLPTLLWSPHSDPPAADALLELAQATLIDSVSGHARSQSDWRAAIERACGLTEQLYVVDLAWLRSTPWRERVAATFDRRPMRCELASLNALTVRHHPDSTVAAMLLVGWLASRLGWELDRAKPLKPAHDAARLGAHANAAGRDIEVRLESAPALQVPGLESVELASASGVRVRLDRGPGGLRVHRRERDGSERRWSLLGASRGEGGILGEGIRQALLRDPTYRPALYAAHAMLGGEPGPCS
jgi:glucose-6-phosphate dehydrogenase assembly protein OpcA